MKRAAAIAGLVLALHGGAVLAGGDPAAGKSKAESCAACHGPQGVSENPMYPILAGQYESYLFRALQQYKSGARQNPIMSGMVANLTEQDMADLAAYYASQEGPLHVP